MCERKIEIVLKTLSKDFEHKKIVSTKKCTISSLKFIKNEHTCIYCLSLFLKYDFYIFSLKWIYLAGSSDATTVLSLRICNQDSKFEGNSENNIEDLDEEILIKCHFAQNDMKMADSKISSWIFVANSISKAALYMGLSFCKRNTTLNLT